MISRCSSPGCRKYASKPEAMKQSVLNSESDTSDDEWIRCTDDVALDEIHGSDRIRDGIYPQVTVPLFSSLNHTDSNNSSITNQLHTDESKHDKNDNEEKMMKCKRPTTFLNVLKKVTDDEDMIKVGNEIDNWNDEKFLSYQERNRYSILVDLLPRRSYSLNILDQIPETLIDFKKEKYFLFTKMIANIDNKNHQADIQDLSNFTHYAIMNDRNDLRYQSGENIEEDEYDNDNDSDDDSILLDQIFPIKRNQLPNFYEFTFDIKNPIRNEITKLSSNIDETLYPFIEQYKLGRFLLLVNNTSTFIDF